jgi:hypothetical protein
LKIQVFWDVTPYWQVNRLSWTASPVRWSQCAPSKAG